MAAAIQYPLVNGRRFDYSSVRISFAGKNYIGVKEISYKMQLQPGDVYGTSAMKLGRTRGQFKPEASFSMYREEWGDFLIFLSTGPPAQQAGIVTPPGGFMEVPFDIYVNIYEQGQGVQLTQIPPQQDKIIGCRIADVDHVYSASADALLVKCVLDVIDIVPSPAPGVLALPFNHLL